MKIRVNITDISTSQSLVPQQVDLNIAPLKQAEQEINEVDTNAIGVIICTQSREVSEKY